MPVNSVRIISWSVGLWLLWTLTTWWFEGRIGTFRRPDAVVDRLIYTAIANILIGVVGAALLLRYLLGDDAARLGHVGFGPLRRTAIWIPVGLALGLALYFGQGAPSTEPVVLLNAFAQVFVVSMAEVVICWALVGGMVALGIGGPRWVSITAAIVVASLLFGVYHFAHSAPFNTVRMVAFLSVIGLVTSAFFFVSRDVYATILFHNFLGVFGVVQALAAGQNIAAFQTPQVPLIATALVALAVLVAMDLMVIRRGAT
jgi:hypothetical protein